MTTDEEFRAAAKLNAHEKVMERGVGRMSMGEMVNVGVDVGVDFERLRVCSVLRRRAAASLQPGFRDYLLSLASQVEEGIQ